MYKSAVIGCFNFLFSHGFCYTGSLTYIVGFVCVVVLLEEHHTKPPEKTKRKWYKVCLIL